MTLYVGTSGWAYKEWKPDFYPADLPQARFLEHYGQHLSACEVNATFYRIQSDNAFSKWASATPPSFRYSAKAHRRITHGKTVAPDDAREEYFTKFFDSVRPLGERLGAVLMQYPPTRKRDDDALKELLAYLPDHHRYAFEFCHESWDSDDVRKVIAESGGTVCFSDTSGHVPEALPPGPIGYVRLRTERYTEKQRAGWLEMLQREAESRDVFAFAKHEGIPTADEYGGVGLAKWMMNALRGP